MMCNSAFCEEHTGVNQVNLVYNQRSVNICWTNNAAVFCSIFGFRPFFVPLENKKVQKVTYNLGKWLNRPTGSGLTLQAKEEDTVDFT